MFFDCVWRQQLLNHFGAFNAAASCPRAFDHPRDDVVHYNERSLHDRGSRVLQIHANLAGEFQICTFVNLATLCG